MNKSIILIIPVLLLCFSCYSTETKGLSVDQNAEAETNLSDSEQEQITSELNEKEVLIDLRKGAYKPSDKIAANESKAVLKYLFGNKKEIIETATVVGKFSGAFTKPNVNETLYYVNGGYNPEEVGGRYGMQSTGWIVVYQNTTPILKIGHNSQSLSITEVNNDGQNEVLIGDGFTQHGATHISEELFQIEKSKLKLILKAEYQDTCGSVLYKTIQTATLVEYVKSQNQIMPKFIYSYWTRKCESKGNWTKLAKNPFK